MSTGERSVDVGSSSSTFTSFDGTTIAYRDHGSGPVVLLVHGYAGTSRAAWMDTGIADALVATGRRVVAIDLRGHGESEKPHDFARYEGQALARDVVALADELGLPAYDLVGYSLGAIVAGTVVQLDRRVRSLVLGGMGDRLMDEDWDRPRLIVAGLTGDTSAAEKEPTVKAVFWLLKHQGGDQLALAGVQLGHVAVPAHVLGALTVPTLVVAGVADDVNGDPTRLAGAIPNARLVLVPGDHVTAMTAPEWRDAVSRFLAEVAPVGGR